MNQSGFSSLAILLLLVLGAVIIWELNESITRFSNLETQNLTQTKETPKEPVCLTGIPDDCNDSNDVFLLPNP